MPRKISFSEDQLTELKEMIANHVPQYKVAEHFGTTDAIIRKICKENNIEAKWYHEYHCVECGKVFYAEHKSALCPECKESPPVCVVCGKEFKKTYPYTQKTCSSKCRGIYRKESGVSKVVAQKMKETKINRYGTLDPTDIVKVKNGSIAKRVCPLCGKEFEPTSIRQVYCTDAHYGPCPVCGKLTEIKDYSIGPQSCSPECRMKRIYATNIQRYGNKDSVNSDYAKELAKKHSLERYGYEYYNQSPEAKQHFKDVMQSKYGVCAPIQVPEFREKAKQTNLEKYGTEWASQSPEVKSKVAQTHQEKYGGIGLASPELRERITSTNLEKYGAEFPLHTEAIQEKMHKNSLEKNGTYWPANSKDAIEKRKATNLEKYGAENPFGSSEIQAKIKEFWKNKYGDSNPMHDVELAKLASVRQQQAMINKYGVNCSVLVPDIKEKIMATNMERYGAPWYFLSEHANTCKISSYNRKFGKWLDNIGVDHKFEFVLADKSYDIKLSDSNILIEIDPTVTHNSISTPWTPDKGRDASYHLMKTELAESNGYRCIHVFDWDNYLNMISMLMPREKIYARNCSISIIDRRTADIFTEKYHLQGKCRGQKYAYGLYYRGKLVQMMSFGTPRYNKKFDLELLRLCTKNGIQIVGGASKLFHHFLEDNPNRNIISYCNRAKFSGKVYEELGMKLDNVSPPAKVWSKGSQYITDNYLRQRGFDQIFNASYGKGTSNEELMLKNGWLPVYDCGQKVFVYNS